VHTGGVADTPGNKSNLPDALAADFDHAAMRALTERVRAAWSDTDTVAGQTVRAKRKLRDQAREFSGLALARLVSECTSGDTSAARIAAAREILDRGFGKPTEIVEVDTRKTEAAELVHELRNLRANPQTRAALLVLANATSAIPSLPGPDTPADDTSA